jgi:hypothetical protein
VASYFGPLSFSVFSNVAKNSIEATVTCNSDRMPKIVSIRIPHPEGKNPVSVSGGTYDPVNESIIIDPFRGSTNIKIEY